MIKSSETMQLRSHFFLVGFHLINYRTISSLTTGSCKDLVNKLFFSPENDFMIFDFWFEGADAQRG